MKRIILVLIIITGLITVIPEVYGAEMDFTAPQVPDSGRNLLPYIPESFAEGLLTVLDGVGALIYPAFRSACKGAIQIMGILLISAFLSGFSNTAVPVFRLVGCVCISLILLSTSNTFIRLGVDTIHELSAYGKLLLPVMTASLAAQGGITEASALYAGTAAFDAVLASLITGIMIPGVYAFLILSISSCFTEIKMLERIKEGIKGLITWALKIILYVFTGYLAITGVVSGTTDAMTLKAAKITISGVVPVVGGILSDASEAVLVGAATMKNAAGIYGILAVLAVCAGPFLQIGMQYLLLKITAAFGETTEGDGLSRLVKDFSAVMGLILAMTGVMGLLFLISTVCFMKGGA